MEQNLSGRHTLSVSFMLMAIVFNVCLIASNLFETKLFMAGPVALVIWTGFLMNFFVVAMAQIVRVLPAAPFWDGGPHFDYVFAMAPRVTMASMLAFLCGSTVNAWIMSRMKVASHGRRFSVRAIVSSLGGETVDSLIFFPIAFWGLGAGEMFSLMATQVVLKTLYEVIILPVTSLVVRKLKAFERIDTFDESISYNPFRILDI